MKRIILSLLVALVALAPQSAAAFEFNWGLTGGYNLTKVKFSSIKDAAANFSSDNSSGWYVGPKIDLGLFAGLRLDVAGVYSNRSLDINGGGDKLHSIEVPINFKYNFGLGSKAAVYISTGPQLGFSVGKSNWNWTTFDDAGNAIANTFSRKDMQTTWNVGVGFRLFSHVELGLGYNFAIGKFGETIVEGVWGDEIESFDNADSRANTFQAQLTYYF